MLKKLEHIGIMVSDMDQSIAFYRDVLGLELVERRNWKGSEIAFLQIGECLLELIASSNDSPKVDAVVNHVAFTVDQLEPVVDKLVQAGTEMLNDKPIDIWDDLRVIFFRGPDGEKLELFERRA